MTSDAAASPETRRSLGQSWPLYAAGLVVLAALLAVYALLHPRSAEAAAEGEKAVPATVTVGAVELRREPSAESGVVASLSAGARVQAKPDLGQWVEVETDAARRGYLPADTIERDPDRNARQQRGKTLLGLAAVFGVVAEEADVTLAPDPLAPRAGRLSRGTVIEIHSVDHSYFAFRDKTWGIAFVSSAHVDLVPLNPREPALSPEKIKPLKNLTIIDLEAEPPPEEEIAESPEEGASAPSVPPPPASAEAAPGLLEPPAVLTRVEPVYPERARRAGIEGTVELEVSIDPSGRVSEVEVVRGLPLGLSEAAAAAVRRWKWTPARTPAGPVAARRTVRIRFVLGSGAP
ncbi:MAG: TonB family protein [Thermoanaerobaculia bacterium]